MQSIPEQDWLVVRISEVWNSEISLYSYAQAFFHTSLLCLALTCTYTHTHLSLNAYPEKPEPINWEFYERNISAPNLVKEFQKQFGAVSVPYPKDTASSAIAEQQKEFVSDF